MTRNEVIQIDKRFVVVIVTLLLQSAGVVWGASAMWSALDELRAADERIEAAAAEMRLNSAEREARLRIVEQGASRMETKLESIADGIERLSAQIDRLVEERP